MTTRSDSFAAAGEALDLRHPQYPIEQLASSRSTRFQHGFARMAMHLMPRFDDAAVEASDNGLVILGASELSLAEPAGVLRRLHADDVDLAAPAVRLRYGDTVEEPVMCVRAVVRREHAETVVHDLIRRGAVIDEVDWLAPAPIVLAKAPLRDLLGYPAALRALCEGTADLEMRLSHYAPLPPGPADAA